MGLGFRHERPQKGRFRQFHQFGAEAYGWPGPDIDAELIAVAARVWKQLGLTRPRLEINSLGTRETRRRYQAELVSYLESHVDRLDDDSVRRIKTNPLRILDSKNPRVQEVLVEAPSILSFLDPECDEEFARLQGSLDGMGIDYRINQRLVRGLDYYSRIVFEWVVDGIGAQSAICAGGRYDDLVAEIGGRPTPAVGFAAGLERIVDLIMEEGGSVAAAKHDVFIVSEGDEARARALVLGEELRDASLRVQVHFGEGGIKNQFKKADKSGAKLAVVIAGQELSEGKVTVKKLRNGGEQQKVDDGEALKTVQELLNSL